MKIFSEAHFVSIWAKIFKRVQFTRVRAAYQPHMANFLTLVVIKSEFMNSVSKRYLLKLGFKLFLALKAIHLMRYIMIYDHYFG